MANQLQKIDKLVNATLEIEERAAQDAGAWRGRGSEYNMVNIERRFAARLETV